MYKKIFIFLFLFFSTYILNAANPRINFQGKITDSGGSRINGNLPVVFSIYTMESGGSALWSEAHNSVNFENGLFTVELGAQNSILGLQYDSIYYLGINVNNNGELQPRSKINYNMFSIKAVYADTAAVAITLGSNISADSIVNLTTNLTNLTNNKADSIHLHLISSISDSIPYSRLSNTPFIPDTINIDNKITDYELRITSLESDSSFKAAQLATVNSQLVTLSDTYLLKADSIVITKVSQLINDSGFILTAGDVISQDSGDLRYILKTENISADSVSGLTTNLTNLTNNKADSVHIHLISSISDSIPYSRLSNTPLIPDTTPYLLISDTANFALKNTGLSNFVNDSNFLSVNSAISVDSVVNLTANLTNLTNNKSDSVHIHLISSISDSIPYSRISGIPFIPDTAPYLLKSDSIVRVSQLLNDSNFITISAGGISQDSGDLRYILKTENVSADSVINLTTNITNLTNNKADSVHLHLISSISDSIPYSRISGMPDTSNFALRAEVNDTFILKRNISDTIIADSIGAGIVSNTEFSYLDGVTSPIQTQFNSKAPIASPNFTGNLTITNAGPLLTFKTTNNAQWNQIYFYNSSDTLTATITTKSDVNQLVFRKFNNSSQLTTSQTFYDSGILLSGNVGIGTSAMSDSLTVAGSIKSDSLTISKFIYADTIIANKFIGDGSELSGISLGGSGIDTTSADARYRLISATISADSVVDLTTNLTNLTNNKANIANPVFTGGMTIGDSLSVGTDTFVVLQNGNVGIGVTASTAKLSIRNLLQVQGSATPQWATSGAGVEIGYDTDDAAGEVTGRGVVQSVDRDAGVNKSLRIGGNDLQFLTGTTGGGTERLRITNSGNIGIGVINPSDSLTVQGNASITDTLAVGTNRLVVSTAGNVGIGITKPLDLLQVNDSSFLTGWRGRAVFSGANRSVVAGVFNDSAIIGAHNSSLTDWATLFINTQGDFASSGNGSVIMPARVGIETQKIPYALNFGTDKGMLFNALTYGFAIEPITDAVDYLKIKSVNAGTNTTNIDNILSIARDGTIGIGTSTPTQKLQIHSSSGGILLTNSSANDATRAVEATIATNEIRGLSDVDLDAGQLRLSAGGGTNANNISYIDMYGFSTRDMRFGTAGVERIRIDGNGNVGIGTANPTRILDIEDISTTEGGINIETQNSSSANAVINLKNHTSVSAAYGSGISMQRARGTKAAPAAILSGDVLGGLYGKGYTGAAWTTNNVAAIRMLAAENFSATNQGTKIDFATTNLGATTRSTKMTIDSEGFVGIGTTNPLSQLFVEHNSPSASDFIGATAVFNNLSNSTGADGIIIRIGVVTPGTGNNYITFSDSNGTVGQIEGNGAGGIQYTTTSDRRRKENIVATRYSLDDLLKIKVCDFNFINKTSINTGFIAQELNEIYPDAVSIGTEDPNEEPWGIDYGKLTPLLVKAVQEQNILINLQKEEIESLKNRIEILEKK